MRSAHTKVTHTSRRTSRIARALLVPLALSISGCFTLDDAMGPIDMSDIEFDFVYLDVSGRVTTAEGTGVEGASVIVRPGTPDASGACALTLMDSPPLRTPSNGSFGHSFVHFEGTTAVCHVVDVTAPSGSGLQSTSVSSAGVAPSSVRGQAKVRIDVVLAASGT